MAAAVSDSRERPMRSLVEPAIEIIHEGSRSCLADLTAQAGGVAPNLTFYIVKLPDTLDGLGLYHRWAGGPLPILVGGVEGAGLGRFRGQTDQTPSKTSYHF